MNCLVGSHDNQTPLALANSRKAMRIISANDVDLFSSASIFARNRIIKLRSSPLNMTGARNISEPSCVDMLNLFLLLVCSVLSVKILMRQHVKTLDIQFIHGHLGEINQGAPMPRTLYGKNSHYQFRNQDPVIDEMYYLVKISKLKLSKIAENCGLCQSTLHNWFVSKQTISPRHDSVKIFFNSFGIKYGQHSKPRLVSSRKAA